MKSIKTMIKTVAFIAALSLVCGSFLIAAPAFAKELSVFAAASLTESLTRIAEEYKKIAPEIEIVYNFDSSGTLKTQIEQGAECDIFLSAAQKQMNELDIESDPKINTKRLDFIKKGTRFNIVSNKVVLIVPKDRNTKGIGDFKDVVTDKVSLVALGNSDVPAGQYAEEIYEHLGLWDTLNRMSRITFCSNVKEVVSQVGVGAADCGVVYSTDAAAAAKSVEIAAKAPAGSHRPIVYPAAVMKSTRLPVEAAAFADFLRSEEGARIFAQFGFERPAK